MEKPIKTLFSLFFTPSFHPTTRLPVNHCRPPHAPPYSSAFCLGLGLGEGWGLVYGGYYQIKPHSVEVKSAKPTCIVLRSSEWLPIPWEGERK
jgi:hypothetical protein